MKPAYDTQTMSASIAKDQTFQIAAADIIVLQGKSALDDTFDVSEDGGVTWRSVSARESAIFTSGQPVYVRAVDSGMVVEIERKTLSHFLGNEGERLPIVTATTGPGGGARKQTGFPQPEMGVGSVIYAQRQHPGYLPANGAVYSIAGYPELREAIGTVPDGVGTWTARTSAADNDWFSVCWSPELSLFCAVAASGTGNRVMTSPDGINWTARTSAADNNWRSVCWSPEL